VVAEENRPVDKQSAPIIRWRMFAVFAGTHLLLVWPLFVSEAFLGEVKPFIPTPLQQVWATMMALPFVALTLTENLRQSIPTKVETPLTLTLAAVFIALELWPLLALSVQPWKDSRVVQGLLICYTLLGGPFLLIVFFHILNAWPNLLGG
jgi:hypothetical protein